MKEIFLEEKKKIMLDMLCEIDKFCGTNGLKYYLTAGTLLGAVRHEGYIPWDDDIDICLLREDYERFRSSFDGFSNTLSILNPKSKGYIWPFIKVVDNRTFMIENGHKASGLGVNIDVFPMDKLPNNLSKAKKHVKRVGRIRDLLLLKHMRFNKKRNFFKNVIIFLGKILYLCPDSFFINRIDKLSTLYKNEDSNLICNLVGAYGIKEITSIDNFSNSIYLNFEGHKFTAPCGYDKVLQSLYGEYMILPPLEKRITHHVSKEYWK